MLTILKTVCNFFLLFLAKKSSFKMIKMEKIHENNEVNKTGERLKNEGSNINATASEPPVYYYSKQNDCLRTELQNIFDNSVLFPRTIPFAEEAFGTSLEAVNLWVGDERAVSSMHKVSVFRLMHYI